MPMGEDIAPDGGFAAQSTWGGVKWYPGCYTGDSEHHQMTVAYVIPANIMKSQAYPWWPTLEKAKAYWEEML
eukprot:138078-Karenia_brevis.AAC.1